jgi:hypothetical protein
VGCQWALRGVDFTKQPSFHEATVMMKPGRLRLASNTQTAAFWRATRTTLVVEKHYCLPLPVCLRRHMLISLQLRASAVKDCSLIGRQPRCLNDTSRGAKL